nr:4-alpha-glucanotransferase (DPE1) [Polytomella parva]
MFSYVYSSSGNGTYITVPYGALSDVCDDNFPVGFMVSLPESLQSPFASCRRSLTDVSTSCTSGGRLSPSFYSTVAILGGTTTVSVSVIEAWHLNPTSSSLTSLSTSSVAATSYNSTSDTCFNALTVLNLTFYYDASTAGTGVNGNGLIKAIEMSYTVTDVANAYANASSNYLTQSVMVNWVPMSATRTSTSNSSTINSTTSTNSTTGDVTSSLSDGYTLRQTSGNPGYLVGFPVLAGTLSSLGNKTAISELINGFPVGGAGAGGLCSSDASSPLLFGFNATSSCAVEFTEAELQSFCMNGTAAQYISLNLPVYGNSLYLGIWGNSNISNTNEWVQAASSPSPLTFSGMTYANGSKSCSGVVTDVDIIILTGKTSAANNPQNKILYATISYQTGRWKRNANLGSLTVQRFYLKYNVTFVGIPQSAQGYERALPPLVKPLSVEILYPFTTNAAPERNGPPKVRILMLISSLPVLVASFLMMTVLA